VGTGPYAIRYDPTGSPWSFSGTAGVSGNGSGFTSGNPNAPQGSQVAFVQNSGSISQWVPFSAGTYAITFEAARRGNYDQGWLGFTQGIEVLVDGNVVGQFIAPSTTYTTEITNPFTVTWGGGHTISFVGVNPLGGDHTTFIDQVRISSPNRLQGLLGDPGVAAVAGSLLNRDHYLSRNDMIQIFREAEYEDGTLTVTGVQINDFRTLVSNATFLGMPDYVRDLSNKVANGDPANWHYQGGFLGNLSTSTFTRQLEELVDKWFLGSDHPQAAAGLVYLYAHGSLFGSGGPSPRDVVQGESADCYFLAPLAETAFRQPGAIRNMFIDNGDGTYTVRFFDNGVADYVTVDRYLPFQNPWDAFLFGNPFYYANFGRGTAGNDGNVLWVALAEKAYAQLSESGWNGRPNSNAYSSLDWGNTVLVLPQVTGRPASWNGTSWTANPMQTLVNEFNAGDFITLCSAATASSGFVPSHVYALTGYDPSTQTFTLYNPWGYYVTGVTWAQIQANFDGWGYVTP
jgi:hypothetical protein